MFHSHLRILVSYCEDPIFVKSVACKVHLEVQLGNHIYACESVESLSKNVSQLP